MAQAQKAFVRINIFTASLNLFCWSGLKLGHIEWSLAAENERRETTQTTPPTLKIQKPQA